MFPQENVYILAPKGAISRVSESQFSWIKPSNLRDYACYGFTSRDGAVVRTVASHQCGPGLIPGLTQHHM